MDAIIIFYGVCIISIILSLAILAMKINNIVEQVDESIDSLRTLKTTINTRFELRDDRLNQNLKQINALYKYLGLQFVLKPESVSVEKIKNGK